MNFFGMITTRTSQVKLMESGALYLKRVLTAFSVLINVLLGGGFFFFFFFERSKT